MKSPHILSAIVLTLGLLACTSESGVNQNTELLETVTVTLKKPEQMTAPKRPALRTEGGSELEPVLDETTTEEETDEDNESIDGEIMRETETEETPSESTDESSAESSVAPTALTYPIVDTGVVDFYSDSATIGKPARGSAFDGQDAHYQINPPSYTDNGDGTITDQVTGLMWQQDMGAKLPFSAVQTQARNATLGGHRDWRVPTLKELYSLIQFTGRVKGESAETLFIDTRYFDQPLGDTQAGEREIDAQVWSATEYVSTTMRNDETVFGVNFIDGRIKGYPQFNPRTRVENTLYLRLVRGNPDYGKNHLVDNGDGTISDLATGLMWQQADDGQTRDWQGALAYARGLNLAGHTDWRLPNAKELHSIVDYSRSPATHGSPAIDPLFQTTEIRDPNGNSGQYPYYWTSTTHLDGQTPAAQAVYFAFGACQGNMNNLLLDVHGAGCQRSDPKSGAPGSYPSYFGPQGDVRYVFNYVRAVRSLE